MAQLFVRLTGRPHETDEGLDAPCEWLLREEGGDVVVEGSGSLVDLGHEAPWGDDTPDVVALAPVERVLCLSRTVPGRSVSQIARALPFAVEEFVTQDIETMHLAHGPITRGRPVSCVLVDRQLVTDWLAAIRSIGLSPAVMAPDAGLLPDACEITVLFEGDDALLRTPGHLLRIDRRALPGTLAAIAPDAPNDTPAVPAARLEVIGGTPAQTDALRQVFPGEVDAQPLEEPVLRFLASHYPASGTINMLQGAFAPARRNRGTASRWRAVAALAAVWVLLFTGMRFGEGLWADHRADALQADAAALFRELYPEARPPRNAYTEMRRRVGQPDQPAAADFELLLGALALAIDAALEGVELRSLSYSAGRGELTTELSLREYADLDRLRLQLEAEGVVVHIGSAEEQDGVVRARLRVAMG